MGEALEGEEGHFDDDGFAAGGGEFDLDAVGGGLGGGDFEGVELGDEVVFDFFPGHLFLRGGEVGADADDGCARLCGGLALPGGLVRGVIWHGCILAQTGGGHGILSCPEGVYLCGYR